MRALFAEGDPEAALIEIDRAHELGRRFGDVNAQALALVGEKPGITIPELADAMGIKQNYLYRVMPGLAEEGKVTKSGRGWHLRN